MVRKFAFTGLAAVSLLAIAAPASAATRIYSFTLADAAGLGSGPYGSVQVTENAGKLDFAVQLATGFTFRKTTAVNHQAFTFGLVGDPAGLQITNLTSGFTAYNLSAGTGVNAPPFPAAYTGISCGPPACLQNGPNKFYSGPLSFTVMKSGTALTLNSLMSNLSGLSSVYFTADVRRTSNGATGNVGAVLVNGAVPEPSAWALLIVGFGAIGAGMRRRSGQTALASV